MSFYKDMKEYICPKCGARSHRAGKCRKDGSTMELKCPHCGYKECICN